MSISLNTSVGEIKIELFCEECPEACDNFLKLAASGYYNDCFFHRILPSFLIQTGDGSRKGDGGTSISGEPMNFKPFGDFSQPGLVAYAERENIRSQFFITASKAVELTGKYVAFGHVIYGLNNVQSISRIPTLEDHFPIRSVTIQSITIHANPLAG